MKKLMDWASAEVGGMSVWYTVCEDGVDRWIKVHDHAHLPIANGIRYPEIAPDLLDIVSVGADAVRENCVTALAAWLPRNRPH